MFKQLALLGLLMTISSTAMLHDEDKDSVFFLLGTITCPGEKIVASFLHKNINIALKEVVTGEAKTKAKNERNCFSMLKSLIEEHYKHLPPNPFVP